ncbi:hypothetical protein RRG08_025723 [Elysia crispata]|uniref:Uncharacterized protein n=1 Tax=Elysia crispata TaxID=231223 RepID=A0AAE1DYJ6_9GAST|nr:hypothetical protein RRG08_025723 [Elysia crispata]
MKKVNLILFFSFAKVSLLAKIYLIIRGSSLPLTSDKDNIPHKQVYQVSPANTQLRRKKKPKDYDKHQEYNEFGDATVSKDLSDHSIVDVMRMRQSQGVGKVEHQSSVQSARGEDELHHGMLRLPQNVRRGALRPGLLLP